MQQNTNGTKYKIEQKAKNPKYKYDKIQKDKIQSAKIQM